MIQAVLFDLDGTLLNRDASVKKFIDNQYERISNYVGHIPKEEYMNRFIDLDCRGYVWKDKVYQQLVDEYKLEIDWEYLLKDYISEFKHHCVPFPHLYSMLEELKNRNLVLGMITNGFGQFQMDNIVALGIEKYFDAILISETEGLKKPDPSIFERALERLNVTASQSVFVGDHPDNDVRASQVVGMKGIWKKDFQWDAFEMDFVVEDLGELPKLIKQLNMG